MHHGPERAKHILWVIENEPAAQITGMSVAQFDRVSEEKDFQTGRDLWLKQCEQFKDNTSVLGNAAQDLHGVGPSADGETAAPGPGA